MHRKEAAAKEPDKGECKEGEDSFKNEIQSRDVLDNELQLCIQSIEEVVLFSDAGHSSAGLHQNKC